jgi:hypothetical protein
MRTLAAILFVLPFCALAQAPQGSPGWGSQQAPSAPDFRDPEVRAAAQKQQAAYLAYQKCAGEHWKEFELFTATSQLIQARNNRVGIEAGLASNLGMRARWPGGYEQIVGESFETYRKAGGTAATPEAVVAGADPCPPPAVTKPAGKP